MDGFGEKVNSGAFLCLFHHMLGLWFILDLSPPSNENVAELCQFHGWWKKSGRPKLSACLARV